MEGILVINKPQEWTSHDCVAVCRRATGVKRVGHGGTLDPMAEGVLPVFIGRATRIMEYMDLGCKTYRCCMRLGIVTDTEDIWGEVLEERSAEGITEDQIRQTAELLKRAAKGLTGDPVLEQRLWRRLPAELKYLGLRLCGLRVFRSGQDRPEIYLSLQTVRDTRVSVKSIAELLSECCHQKLRPAWNCPAVIGHVSGNFHFVAETRYQMLCGISKVTKAGELVSGDS